MTRLARGCVGLTVMLRSRGRSGTLILNAAVMALGGMTSREPGDATSLSPSSERQAYRT